MLGSRLSSVPMFVSVCTRNQGLVLKKSWKIPSKTLFPQCLLVSDWLSSLVFLFWPLPRVHFSGFTTLECTWVSFCLDFLMDLWSYLCFCTKCRPEYQVKFTKMKQNMLRVMEKQFFWMKMPMRNTNDFLILSFVFNITWVTKFSDGFDFHLDYSR